MKKKIIYFIITICALLWVMPVSAQEVTLSMFPPITELFVKPGKTLLIGYTVQNLGDPTTLQFKVRGFSPQGDYGEMTIDNELISPIRFSLDNTDVTFEQPFFMKQRDTTQALLRIRIPEGTPEGDYYFAFLAETQPVPTIGGTTNSLAQATIGSNLLLTVTQTGLIEVKAAIALFSIKPDFIFHLFGKEYQVFESSNKVPVNLIIQNQGKNLIKPNGELTLKSMWGDKRTYPLLSQNILANSKRLIKTTDLNNTDPHLSALLSGYFVGPYSLSTNITFQDDKSQLVSTISFIGIPFKFLATIFGVSIISVFIILFIRKKSKE